MLSATFSAAWSAGLLQAASAKGARDGDPRNAFHSKNSPAGAGPTSSRPLGSRKVNRRRPSPRLAASVGATVANLVVKRTTPLAAWISLGRNKWLRSPARPVGRRGEGAAGLRRCSSIHGRLFHPCCEGGHGEGGLIDPLFYNWAFDPTTYFTPKAGGGGPERRPDRTVPARPGLRQSAARRPRRALLAFAHRRDPELLPPPGLQMLPRHARRLPARRSRAHGRLPPSEGRRHRRQGGLCGGGDIGADRWDTIKHLDNDRRRRRAHGKCLVPAR